MLRRSHRQHQDGSSAEFWDDDDLYEGHTAARERNHDVYEDKDGDFNNLSLDKGSRARRPEKAKVAQATVTLERDYVMTDYQKPYQKHYKFVETIVNNLLIFTHFSEINDSQDYGEHTD